MIGPLLLAALVVLGVPAVALAHGGGHGAAKAVGSAVSVDGYRIEVLSDPAPLAAGRESRVIARLAHEPSGSAVSGATVQLGVARAEATSVDTVAAPEVTWAGSYTAAVTPRHTGPHRARIVVTEVPGRRFDPPLAIEIPLTVEPRPGLGVAVWLTIFGSGGLVLLFVYGTAVRARTDQAAAASLDLLRLPWLRRLLTSSWLQPALQVPLLALMALVAVVGLVDVQDGARNLATKLTWTIWWAGIIFTFVLAGRIWCLACPFGALTEWSSRWSGAWRRLPRIFRNLWWATGLFLALTWADEQLGVVRSPRVTAWIVIGFAALAVAVGLRYQRRSFCRHLCPIGGLIGIYSMTAPVELRAGEASTCRGHATKECFQGTGHSRGCPMLEFPQSMDRNNYCTFCAECVKGCSRSNIVLRFRAFGRDLWATGRRVMDESYLAVALVGLTMLVTAQMLSAWPEWIAALARWLPPVIRASLKPVTYLTLVESVLLLGGTLVVSPLLVLAAAAVANRRAGADALGLRRTFVVFGYMFVPVGLAMHLAHNLAHLLLEGGGIVPVVQRAVALYTPFVLGEPDWHVAPLAPPAVVAVLQAAVVVGFFVLSLVAGRRLALRTFTSPLVASRALLPFALLSLAFTVAGLVLLQQPMGMRHGM
jgi:polyferredoxin